MAAKAELELREILLTTGLLQPLKVESKGSRVHALCRLLPGQEETWLAAAGGILESAEGTDFKFGIGTQLIWKDGLVKGWYLTIDAKNKVDVAAHLDFLRAALDGVAPKLVIEQEHAPAPDPHLKKPLTDEDLEEPLEEERQPSPEEARKIAERQALYRRSTTAPPRAPDLSLRADPKQPKEPPRLRVVERGTAKDHKNRMVPVTVEEMPLPHIDRDLNELNPKGRGAKTI